ncbi:MAG: pseudouridine synthase [Acidimicrobiales bacterium]
MSTEDRAGTRLQKILARAGYGSRRTAEELIANGRVRVNGRTAALGRRVVPGTDRVEVDGVAVGILPDLVAYLVNKPPGVVTTAQDPEGRPTILDLLPASPRVFAVGRLDLDSEGLIICTNDGELAQLLAHPSHGVEKEYLCEVEGDPSREAVRRLRDGVEIDEGVVTRPAAVSRRAPGVLRITIHEGRNRQVRKMCEAVGHPVRRLVRTRIGSLRDQQLKPGEYRVLRPGELVVLRDAARGIRHLAVGRK